MSVDQIIKEGKESSLKRTTDKDIEKLKEDIEKLKKEVGIK